VTYVNFKVFFILFVIRTALDKLRITLGNQIKNTVLYYYIAGEKERTSDFKMTSNIFFTVNAKITPTAYVIRLIL